MAVPTRLFVGNLPDITVEDDLKTAFGSFGEITNIDLKSKPGDQNKSNKFAFISICASNANIESCKWIKSCIIYLKVAPCKLTYITTHM